MKVFKVDIEIKETEIIHAESLEEAMNKLESMIFSGRDARSIFHDITEDIESMKEAERLENEALGFKGDMDELTD